MSTSRARLGLLGEQLAARYLEASGLRIVDRNWRCAVGALRGELDIVAWDGATLVFCEVKARRGVNAGVPLEAVHARKQAQLRRLATAWLAATGTRASAIRFDVVGVFWPLDGGRHRIAHVKAAC